MADWERARQLAPAELMAGGKRGELAIKERLAANPEIAYQIVRDVYDAALAEEERERGIRRTGRRPTPTQVPLREVFARVFPGGYSMDPFPLALEKLLNGRSLRAFAPRVPCHFATLSRLLSGALKPDLSMMARIAEAGGVAPTYFREYRAQFIGQLIINVFTENPNMSVTAFQQVRSDESLP